MGYDTIPVIGPGRRVPHRRCYRGRSDVLHEKLTPVVEAEAMEANQLLTLTTAVLAAGRLDSQRAEHRHPDVVAPAPAYSVWLKHDHKEELHHVKAAKPLLLSDPRQE